jgi:transposase-like protein
MGSQRENRRRHSAAFKCEAVQVLNKRRAAGVSLRRVSAELELDPGVLTKWAQAVAAAPPGVGAEDIFPGSGRPRVRDEAPTAPDAESPELELRRLRRENERLRQERDFLKKAAAFFAKESR